LTRVFQRIGDKIYKTLVPDPFESSPTPAGQWHRTHTEPDDCLFKDILVPVNGQEEGWSALEQAVIMSRCTGTRLNGLHVVPDPSLVELKDALSVRQEFQQRSQSAGFEGGLAVVSGEVAPQVCEWALLNDLVILNLAHPPASEILARLGSGFRTIIRRCSRPILAVPGQASPLNRLLLAFDGSLKAKEALYISAFFAGKWDASLVVLTTQESGHTTTRTIKTAEKYLTERQVRAKYIEKTGSAADNIMQVAAEEESNLLLMGGYGFSPMVEAVLGSTVDQVLRSTLVPVLICQ
jgi:nucleotide-binding universal stress UspA family protein